MGLAFGGLILVAPGVTHAVQAICPCTGAQQPQGVGGVRVGEATYLRLGVAAEAGYDSNVFYNDENKVDSATLRVTPSIELTNASRDGSTPPLALLAGGQPAVPGVPEG